MNDTEENEHFKVETTPVYIHSDTIIAEHEDGLLVDTGARGSLTGKD